RRGRPGPPPRWRPAATAGTATARASRAAMVRARTPVMAASLADRGRGDQRGRVKRIVTPDERSVVQRLRAMVALAVGAHLLAVAADLHVAPDGRAVSREVVESPLAAVREGRA